MTSLLRHALIIASICNLAYGATSHAQPQPNFDDRATREQYIKWSTDEITRKPQDYKLYLARGYAYVHDGKLEQALTDLNKANELEPNNVYVLTTRAQMFIESKDWKSAITDETAAIKLKPEMSGLYSNRGVCYMYAGNLAEAQKDAQKSLQLDPQSYPAFELFGELAYKNGKYAECIKYCNEVLKRNSAQPDAFYFRGCAYEKLGNPAQGKADKDKAARMGYHGQMLYKRSDK